jgi:hypothetical protein
VTTGTTQTISGEKTFSNSNTYITGTLNTATINPTASSTTTNKDTTQISGVSNISNSNTRTGAINLGNGTGSSNNINIGNVTNAGGTINIGSINSSTQLVKINSQNVRINTGFIPTSGITTIGGTEIQMTVANTYINNNLRVSNIIGQSGSSLGISTAGTDDLYVSAGGNVVFESVNGTISIYTNGSSPLMIDSAGDLNLSGVTTYISATSAINFSVNSQINLIPAGSIITSVVSSISQGYLYCDGSSYSTSTYANLFSAIGYTFGGAGASFNVPNFKGAFLRGASTQTVGGVAYTAAAVGTAQQDQVLSAKKGKQQGYFDVGGSGEECVARSTISGDPLEDSNNIAQFDRQGTENRPFNHAVYYYIRYS